MGYEKRNGSKNKALCERYLPIIRKHARWARIPELQEGDLISEFWIAIYEGIPSFEGRNNSSEKTFVEKIIRNTIASLARKADSGKRRSERSFSDMGWTADGERIWDNENES